MIAYKTQGDANQNPDSDYISEAAIIGKNLFTLPYIGRAAAYLRTFNGLFAFIILPSLLFVLFEIINIKKEIVKEAEKSLLAKMHLASQGPPLQVPQGQPLQGQASLQ